MYYVSALNKILVKRRLSKFFTHFKNSVDPDQLVSDEAG